MVFSTYVYCVYPGEHNLEERERERERERGREKEKGDR